jgi:branched-chain amino acid aminotransferase
MAVGTWSKTWTFFEGEWHEGNLPLWGVRTHAIWLGSSVFDGARAFEGTTPDLDLHCARVNASAQTMFLKAVVPVEQWLDLVCDGIKRFDPGMALYIRPMYWAERAGPQALPPDSDSTRWCLALYDVPMRKPEGFSITLSPFKRPTIDTAPVDAKAGCLYPNNARALLEARSRGFDNCIVCDFAGNVAELANSNVFMAKDGVVYTPIPNGTFLNGITRQRTIKLLRADGVQVVETVLRYRDFETADEIFATGNASKAQPIIRIGDRALQPGPMFRKARELYWAFAHAKAARTKT